MKAGSIAIIIGVSDYGASELRSLPSCSRDAEAIEKVIIHTGRFLPENTFKASGRVDSNQLKADLSNFFAARSDWVIEELFFYFSGHGDYTANEFYYLLSDYESARLRQSSLEGTEIDNLVRNTNPNLYVKIVDACHSGLRYIKSRDDFDSYVKGFSGSFANLYFMFSSLSEQYSFGGDDLSRFTRYMIKAVKDAKREQLRYKDLIDAVSDAMIASGQTPYFINQAKFTELFCEVDAKLRDELAVFISESPSSIDVSDKGEAEELYDIIKMDAERYASHDEAKDSLQRLAEDLTILQIPPELENYYLFEPAIHTKGSTLFKGIGSWLEQELAGEQFFAEPTYVSKTRTKRVPIQGYGLSLMVGTKNYEEVQESYEQLSGFENTVDVPLKYISKKQTRNFQTSILQCVSLFLLYQKHQ